MFLTSLIDLHLLMDSHVIRVDIIGVFIKTKGTKDNKIIIKMSE